MAQDNILAVIDIGSSETKVLVVDLEPQLQVIGAFCAKTEGMRKGEIVNLGALKESVHAVIGQAERLAGAARRVRGACLAVSGALVGGFSVKGLTSVKNGVVREEDKEAARSDAFDACLHRIPENRHIVQHMLRRYLLDRREREEPLGLSGRELTYDLWVIDADDTYLTELYQIPNRLGMTVRGLFPASLASAEAVRTFAQVMDDNRLVIDIGAGTSDFVLFRDGAVVCTGVIPVGGEHITNDMSRGLQIRMEDAERLKIKYGNAYARDADVFAEIDLDTFEGELKGFSKHVSRYKMELITELRLRELFTLIMKKINAEEPFSGTVFLTGGTSQMEGIGKLASAIFGNAEVRIGEPSLGFARAYAEPKYSTVVGLAKLYRDALSKKRKSSGKIGWFRRIFRGMF